MPTRGPVGHTMIMNFFEALEVANQKEQLVGKLRINGATLDEIIIAPSDAEEYQEFIKIYTNTLDAQKSIAPYIESDVTILGVFDKYRIRQEGCLAIDKL